MTYTNDHHILFFCRKEYFDKCKARDRKIHHIKVPLLFEKFGPQILEAFPPSCFILLLGIFLLISHHQNDGLGKYELGTEST